MYLFTEPLVIIKCLSSNQTICCKSSRLLVIPGELSRPPMEPSPRFETLYTFKRL